MAGKLTVSGLKVNIAKLRSLPKAFNPYLVEGVASASNVLRNEIITSIARGKHTGRVYDWKVAAPGQKPDGFRKIGGRLLPIVKRRIPHQASAPGETPATDTGRLVSSIAIDYADRGLTAMVFAGAAYARYLEEGTPSMAARPFMQRGLDDKEQEIRRILRQATERAVRAFNTRLRGG